MFSALTIFSSFIPKFSILILFPKVICIFLILQRGLYLQLKNKPYMTKDLKISPFKTNAFNENFIHNKLHEWKNL